MAIILDADVIIRAEKRKFDLQSWIAARPDEVFEVAAITIAELWHGVERATGQHRTVREAYLTEVTDPLNVLPYTKEVALVHAHVWAQLGARGKMISSYDLIVAATALYHNSPVATFNVRHFSRIKGLKIVQPA